MCEVDWAMVLEYLKVFFSWPPVLALLLTFFILLFKRQIDIFISRITELKFPGGSATLKDKEQQQEAASSPEAIFPGPDSALAPITGQGSNTVAMVGGDAINRSYSNRVKALFPAVQPEPIIEWMHLNPGPSFEDYVDKIFQLTCERTFNMIFGTQVQVLIFLTNPTLDGPIPAAPLVPLFEQHRKLIGTSDRPFSEFIGFLLTRDLIKNVGPEDGPLYQITGAGREFLAHIKQYYPFLWNTKVY
jgi:hypothetical protein